MWTRSVPLFGAAKRCAGLDQVGTLSRNVLRCVLDCLPHPGRRATHYNITCGVPMAIPKRTSKPPHMYIQNLSNVLNATWAEPGWIVRALRNSSWPPSTPWTHLPFTPPSTYT